MQSRAIVIVLSQLSDRFDSGELSGQECFGLEIVLQRLIKLDLDLCEIDYLGSGGGINLYEPFQLLRLLT